MKKVVFVQVSDKLMMQQGDGQWIDNYYVTAYQKMAGYHKPEHFMEIPHWIAIISGMLDPAYNREVHIVTNVEESVAYLEKQDAYILCSALDANLVSLTTLISRLSSKRIFLGGYVDPHIFFPYRNVTYIEHARGIALHLKAKFDNHPDYNLFARLKNIPRLTMSRGCLYNCAFCMVPRKLEIIPATEIDAQIESFGVLNYQLIYLDDKTFSQAKNWRYLGHMQEIASIQQPHFFGFIVQTTVNLANSPRRIADFRALGIRYLELGIESLDANILKRMRKPFNLNQLERVMTVAQEFGLPIIPNLIFGTPGEELGLVVRWVHKHRIQIPVVNVNFLSNIYGANSIRKPGDLPVARNACDADQNDYRKSWQNEDSTMRMLQAIRAVFYLTAGEDYTPSLYSEELRKTSIENVLDYFLS